MKAILGFIAAFFVLAFIINYWQWILGIVATIALLLAAWWLGEKAWYVRKARRAEKHRHARELRENAAIQHRLYMEGDKSGVYGEYPPVDLDKL